MDHELEGELKAKGGRAGEGVERISLLAETKGVIKARREVGADAWMRAQGFRPMTAEESRQSAKWFRCADSAR